MSNRRVAKRACDGCKIRKIKCTETSPCEGCTKAGIACTFVKHPSARGPRNLRKNTLKEIRQTQQQATDQTQRQWMEIGMAAGEDGPVTVPQLAPTALGELHPGEPGFGPSQIASLVLQLCVYRLRMYPVWPIIKVERLIASLQKSEPDMEVIALAYAVAAATLAQIKPQKLSQPDAVTADMLEEQCQRARAKMNPGSLPTITTLRLAFFLHKYYENQTAGGLQSVLYMREALTIAQILGLHRESYYLKVDAKEQQLRRRTFWLLFVAERGMSVLHGLPVILRTKIAFPTTEDTDETEVLLAFQKLIGLFWTFDQAGVFGLLDNADFDLTAARSTDRIGFDSLESARAKLSESMAVSNEMNDVQRADIIVTRQWMRVILWRLSASHGHFALTSSSRNRYQDNPIEIAKELLSAASNLPHTAIEAHGTGLELKVFEIASSVVDAVTIRDSAPLETDANELPSDILKQLRKFLSRNKKLDELLRAKITQLNQDQQLSLGLTPSYESQIQQSGIRNSSMDPEIQQQLQAHGFDFSEPVVSPLTDTSDMTDQSPPPQSTPADPDFLPTGQQQLPKLAEAPSQSSDQMWDQSQERDQNLITSQDLFNQFQDFSYDLDPGGDVKIDSANWADPSGAYLSNADDQFQNEMPPSWPQNQSTGFDS